MTATLDATTQPAAPEQDMAQIEAILAAIPDPEIPVVSIRELGILRDVKLTDQGVEVVITPTYSGCPAMEQIRDDVVAALVAHQIKGRVTLQLSPAWTTDWMTAEARDKLRAYGIAPPHSTSGGPCAPGSGLGGKATARPIQFIPKLVANYAHSTRASGLFDQQEPVNCPQCGSIDTTETSHFGSTACKALYKCLACQEPFDYFKPY